MILPFALSINPNPFLILFLFLLQMDGRRMISSTFGRPLSLSRSSRIYICQDLLLRSTSVIIVISRLTQVRTTTSLSKKSRYKKNREGKRKTQYFFSDGLRISRKKTTSEEAKNITAFFLFPSPFFSSTNRVWCEFCQLQVIRKHFKNCEICVPRNLRKKLKKRNKK